MPERQKKLRKRLVRKRKLRLKEKIWRENMRKQVRCRKNWLT